MKCCLICFLLLFGVAYNLLAQDKVSSDSEILAPSEEKFSPVSDLLAPRRETGCYRGNPMHKEPGCKVFPMRQFGAYDTLSLYDENGSLWYRFSLSFQKYDYFLKNRKNAFVPL